MSNNKKISDLELLIDKEEDKSDNDIDEDKFDFDSDDINEKQIN